MRMRIVPTKKAIVLPGANPAQIRAVIPHAKTTTVHGQEIVAIRHGLEESVVLRNMGYPIPSPILSYYDWPRNVGEIVNPFEAQLATAAFLTLNRRAYVLNGLGSGKTQATLWAYDYLKSQNRAVKMIVVAPLSTLELTWAQALFDHFPHLSFMVVHAARAKRLQMIDEDVDIYITNHDGVKIIQDKLATRFDVTHVVVDEIAQCARNAKTDRWKALNTIVNKQLPRACWGLTATPTPNEPTDAWAQCRLVTPETVPRTFTRFRDQVMRQVGPYLWLPRENATDVVHEVMQPAIRFSREECVDLPPTTYAEHHVPLSKEQEVAYKLMESTLKAQIDSGEVTAVNEAVKANKLVQIACGVVYDKGHEVLELPNKARVQETLDLIQNSHGAVIVFVPFVSAVEYVAQKVRDAGYSVGVVHGGIGKTARDEVFNSFQRSRTLEVIVAQPAAMSHGLTLTAASTIVWYAPITSADIFEQANGRITRPSQKHNTLIAMISGTVVERKMYKRLKNKQKMQNLLLDRVVDSREA